MPSTVQDNTAIGSGAPVPVMIQNLARGYYKLTNRSPADMFVGYGVDAEIDKGEVLEADGGFTEAWIGREALGDEGDEFQQSISVIAASGAGNLLVWVEITR